MSWYFAKGLISKSQMLTTLTYRRQRLRPLHSPEARYWNTKPHSDNQLPPYLISAAAAKSLQSCLALCDPTDGTPLGSPIPRILQARTLEWVAISFSNAWKWKVKVKSLSRVQLFETPWTAAHQAPPSMGFSRQEYWSGLPLPSPVYYARYSVIIWFRNINP